MPSTPEQEPQPAGLSDRRRLVYLAAAVALLCALVLPVALLSGGSGDDAGSPTAAAAASGAASSGKVSGPSLEGRLIVVERDRLVMNSAEPVDGKSQFELDVRPQDAAGVDVIHLKVHASQGLPSRIFYEQEGDTRFAVGQQDADTLPAP